MDKYTAQKLPDKPSELIRVALADLKKCEEDARYRIDMSQWHVPTDTICEELDLNKHYCNVCLAGAVMGQTLDVPLNFYASSTSARFDDDTQRKLRAINHLRLGNLTDAFNVLRIDHSKTGLPRLAVICDYCYGIDRFSLNMETLAATLEAAGQ